jgi:hypothetical protein
MDFSLHVPCDAARGVDTHQLKKTMAAPTPGSYHGWHHQFFYLALLILKNIHI